MTLYMIGLGLSSEKDISVKGLEAVQKSSKVFLESYTSLLQCSKKKLETLYGKEIILADRELVEKRADEILKDAKRKNVSFLVIGDVFSATTHMDLYFRAIEQGIKVEVVHNASVLSAIGATGLQVYKFGKITSIPFENEKVITPYSYLEQNKSIGAHTLFLLDLKPLKKKFLTIPEAIEYLFGVEKKQKKKLLTSKTYGIGCARLGSKGQLIKYGLLKDLAKVDFGKPPYCLIIPCNLHFLEEEVLT